MKEKDSQGIKIRPENASDIEAIHAVNKAAFRTDGEARVVDQLRENCSDSDFVSFIAEVNDEIVGQILFTPVELITSDNRIVEGMGLAPLAVLPSYQGRGIGSALCEAGIAAVRDMGAPFVVVLGHPGYYPRFGFTPAVDLGFQCAYLNVPPDAFMIRIFDQKLMNGLTGVIHYRPEFDEVT